jgi:hypothetical protein
MIASSSLGWKVSLYIKARRMSNTLLSAKKRRGDAKYCVFAAVRGTIRLSIHFDREIISHPCTEVLTC